ncbi:unnamed protein product [Blepharisma stoltei]|uniref:Receptor ligand binding region domain-containing protein n=1 Tax=Blepharisma stoltei TaxID=1481888 RepID=A0AAU9IYU9_9CILI|nr:unnamed protein product [Blepharisma stoltei]
MKFSKLKWLFYFCFVSSKLSIRILYSDETEWGLTDQIFNDLNTTYRENIELYQNHADMEPLIGWSYAHPTIVIDLTKNLLLKQKLKDFSRIYDFIVLEVTERLKNNDKWIYSTHISTSNHAIAMMRMLSYLGWSRIGLIYSDSYGNIKFWNHLKEKSFFYNIENALSINFGNRLDQDIADNLIAREIKAKGFNNIIIANEGEGSIKLIKSFIGKNVYKKGFGVILGSQAIWGPNEDGLVFIVEKDLEFSESTNHYHSLSIIKLINNIINSDSIYSIKEQLDNYTENHEPLNIFSIVNIQNSIRKIVGCIDNFSLSLANTIIFPGSTSEIPNSEKQKIAISEASGDTNYNGLILGQNGFFKIGADFALKYSKINHYLEDFNIVLHSTDCSADFYDYNFSYSCLSNEKSNIGVAFLPSYSDDVCYGTVNDFRSLGIKVPLISDQCTSDIFTNKTAYPEFIRIMKSYAFHSNTLAYLMSIFSWKCAVVFYENSTFGLVMYNHFIEIASSLGIKIVNDENKRMLDPFYNPEMYENYSDFINNAINTKCRIIVPLLQSTAVFNLFGQLYDKGIRLGDFIYLVYFPMAGYFEYSPSITDETKQKVIKLAYGSLGLWQSEWVGSYGASLKALGDTFYDPSWYGGNCPSFDAMTLVLHGLKYTINEGNDYENPELLNEGIRKVKFTGCSGTVQISSNSNEKNTAIISIMNSVYNKTLGHYVNIEVGSYTVGSNPPFLITKNITWPDNTTNTPNEKRQNPDNCPFNLHLIQDSDAGHGLYYGFVFGITFIVTILSTIILIKLYWHSYLPIIIQRCEVKANDYVAMAMIFIDFLQYLAMGPDLSVYDEISSFLYDYASINLSVLIEFKGDAYWIAIIITFSICVLWVFLSMFVYFRIDEYKNIDILDSIGIFGRFITPIIGNLGLIPITHILLTVFECEKGIGNKIDESFMDHDCSVFCYKDQHIFFAILSFLTLLIYLPLSIMWRPIWQSINSNTNIYLSPQFLVSKSIFQIISVALNKTLKHHNQWLEGLVYLIFTLAFIYYTLYYKPYNYQRCSLWTTASLVALAWSLIVSSFYYALSYSYIPFWIILQFAGWFVILLTTLIIQHEKYPSLFFSPKGADINILFKFALTKQIEIGDIKKRATAYEISDPALKADNEVDSKFGLIDSRSLF